MPQEQQRKTRHRLALDLAKIFYDTIKESGENGVPSGHLYATVCGSLDFDTYNSIISILKKHGFVKECNFVLTAHIPTKGGDSMNK